MSTATGQASQWSAARYLALFLGFAGLLFSGLAGFNAAADTYCDFYFLTGWRRPRTRSLDNYADVKFKARRVLETGRDGLDAAIFGSSRVMRIDPADAALARLAPRAMNLGVQGAHLGQAMDFVEFVTRRSPRCLPIIGLDFFAFGEGPLPHSIYLDERRPFPAWQDACLRLASDRLLPVSLDTLRGKPGSNRLLSNGLAIRVRPETAAVRAQLESFAARDWQQDAFFRTFHYDPSKAAALRAFRAQHPQAVFFVNPASRWYREGQEKAGLGPAHARWLSDLAEVGRVIDFTGAKSITDDAERYYDTHHYDTVAGGMILHDVVALLQEQPLTSGRLLEPAAPH